MGWHDIMAADELWPGELLGVTAGGVKVALLNVDGVVRAYLDRCPHQENTLSDGMLDGGTLTCSYHLWEFDAATGCGLNPATCRLSEYPVKVEHGRILIDVASAALADKKG